MCEYCENGKEFTETGTLDNIYFTIYGKHLRVSGEILGIPLGRDVIINYCPICGKELCK